ncbi:hypothetical protein EUGRSUZ_E00088 [Eucalyptus grandis]|uniref:Uncharacterized protein n=2 Tax=Eucalyptus grandis TaxID=71139 RepID=A0ACC3KR84_EUCGR|nr:hypothetical protein EUGRSUZ_E00088 [Eucalyptus grandis]
MSDIQDQVDEFDLVAKGGVYFLEETLPMIKVLIFLDDLDIWLHFNEIFGEERDFFGHGFRIIVTTSNKSVLLKSPPQRLDCIYCISMMNDNLALALQGNLPISDFDEIARGIIDSVNGIPLFIKVIGILFPEKWWKNGLHLGS